jgi:hypothetical protein
MGMRGKTRLQNQLARFIACPKKLRDLAHHESRRSNESVPDNVLAKI